MPGLVCLFREGSKEDIFDMVKYLANFPKWSPFLAQDPSQK